MSFIFSTILIILSYIILIVAQPITTIGNITIIGTFLRTRSDRLISTFRGIPYAEPPIWNLSEVPEKMKTSNVDISDKKFRNPVPKKLLNSTLMAIKDGSMCIQYYFDQTTDEGSEDCLYLNVYTPQITKNEQQKLLPVMVYIHGGCYTSGSSNSTKFGPDYLLEKNVVLVTINYRLGIFGFLSTGDAEAPGNFGLKDQVIALRWVQKNIRNFGGDSEKVTLFGLSAGANSIDLHTLSESTNGLFHQYILESGGAITPRSFEEREQYSKYAWKVGELFNCPLNDSRVMVNCLRNVEAYRLNNSTNSVFSDTRKYFQFAWSPTDEPNIDGAFLTDTPFKLLNKKKRKDYPWIQGVTKDEGIYFMGDLYVNADKYNEVRNNLDTFLTDLFKAFPLVKNISQVVTDIKKFYFDSNVMSDKKLMLQQMSNLLGDIFRWPYAMKLANWHSQNAKQPLYFYLFDYRGTISFSSSHFGTNAIKGVDHGDETLYLFPVGNDVYKRYNLTMSENDFKMVDIMVNFWTSFATNGVPLTTQASNGIVWKPYKPGNNILKIGNNSEPDISIVNSLNEDRMKFWFSRLFWLILM